MDLTFSSVADFTENVSKSFYEEDIVILSPSDESLQSAYNTQTKKVSGAYDVYASSVAKALVRKKNEEKLHEKGGVYKNEKLIVLFRDEYTINENDFLRYLGNIYIVNFVHDVFLGKYIFKEAEASLSEREFV